MPIMIYYFIYLLRHCSILCICNSYGGHHVCNSFMHVRQLIASSNRSNAPNKLRSLVSAVIWWKAAEVEVAISFL